MSTFKMLTIYKIWLTIGKRRTILINTKSVFRINTRGEAGCIHPIGQKQDTVGSQEHGRECEVRKCDSKKGQEDMIWAQIVF